MFQEGAIDFDMITPIMLNHILEYISLYDGPWYADRGLNSTGFFFDIVNKKWSKEEMERNEETESRMILTDFSFEDTGKSRQLVCTMNVNHPDYREYRKLIEHAPSLLNELKAMVNLFDRNLPEGSIGRKACDDANFLIRELSA